MDSLPSLIITKILSLLSAKDVVNFTQLCSAFRQIISKNRIYLRRPLFSVEIYNYRNDPKENIAIKIYRSNKFDRNCNSFYAEEPSCLTKPFDYADYYRFFHPYFAKKQSHQNLLGQFEFMFDKGDVDELSVIHLNNSGWFQCLTAAIKSTSVKINTVLASPCNPAFREECRLLRVIANQKYKQKVKPRLRIGCNQIRRKRRKLQLAPLNEICALYSSARFEINRGQRETFLKEISLLRKKTPFPKYNFHVYAISWRVRHPTEKDIKINGSKVEVIKKEAVRYDASDERIFEDLDKNTEESAVQLGSKDILIVTVTAEE